MALSTPNLSTLVYNSEGFSLDVQLESDTIWLTQKQMAVLFDRDYKTISKHILNIIKDGEYARHSVVAKKETTGSDGKTYKVEYYNLDMIISVGYRVKSQKGIKFRQWATKILKEHLLYGYSVNEFRDMQEHVKVLLEKDLKNNVKLEEVAETLAMIMQRLPE